MLTRLDQVAEDLLKHYTIRVTFTVNCPGCIMRDEGIVTIVKLLDSTY